MAFSGKGRRVCPPRNTRRIAEAAAHLRDDVYPRQPMRQWVRSVSKRPRYYSQHDKSALHGLPPMLFDALTDDARQYIKPATSSNAYP